MSDMKDELIAKRPKKFPTEQHPLFAERYDGYANSFNALAEQMNTAQIPVALLHEVVNSTRAFEELAADIAYEFGLDRGLASATRLMAQYLHHEGIATMLHPDSPLRDLIDLYVKQKDGGVDA